MASQSCLRQGRCSQAVILHQICPGGLPSEGRQFLLVPQQKSRLTEIVRPWWTEPNLQVASLREVMRM